MLADSGGQTGDLPSGDTDGTCLNFLAPASCARFMRPPQTSWLRWMRRVLAILAHFSSLPRARLRHGGGRRGLLRLRSRRGLLIGIDLQRCLEGRVRQVQVGVRGKQVRHGRGWWPSGTTRRRLSTMLSAPAFLARRAFQRLTGPL